MNTAVKQTGYATIALIFGLAAAAPPASASCVCRHWRAHPRVAAHRVHARWDEARWALNGWGPGVGFYALTGVAVDTPPIYNHPYYYGRGLFGNCGRDRLVYDARGDLLGPQAVYVC